MNVIGDPAKIAWQFELHPSSPLDIAEAYGTFQIWVGGRLYGRGETDATALACSFDHLSHLLEVLRSDLVLDPGNSSPLQLFATFYSASWEAAASDVAPLAPLEAKTASMLEIAPDGDEAFDDGTHAYMLPTNDVVIVVAGKIRQDPLKDKDQRSIAHFHTEDGLFLEAYDLSSCVVSRLELQATLARCLAIAFPE